MTTTLRRAVASGAVTLMTASGLAVAASPALAQNDADTERCATSQTEERRWGGSLGTRYELTKEVIGDGTVAPGGEVTFRTTISGAGALASRIDDFHPEGFVLVEARESVWHLLGGQQWATVTDDVRRNSEHNSVYRESAGWTTGGSAYVTLETTYRVPSDAVSGDVLNTGAGVTVALADGRWVENPIDTCVTIREQNPAEQITGSLDGLGFGSVTDGSTAAGEVSSDPAAFSADLINGIDIGQIIAGAAGS